MFPPRSLYTLLLVIAGFTGVVFAPAGARADCPDVGTLVFNDVTVVAAKPFEAKQTRTIVTFGEDGSQRTAVWKAKLFRDSEGRVRVERFFDGTDHPAENTPVDIAIYQGCGMTVMLSPSSRTAKLMQIAAAPRTSHAPFCREIDANHLPKPGSMGTFEDLGHKMIDGVEARGERTTFYATAEAKLSGAAPVSINENWCSTALDNLLYLFTLHQNPKTEITAVISDLLREEPDADLFQVPSDYTVVRASDKK